MKINEKIRLDLDKSGIRAQVFAKQYDGSSRFLEIELRSGGERYYAEPDITARLQLTKPDGNTVINDCIIRDGNVIAELTPQILAQYGTATAEIRLYRGASLLGSENFYIRIEKAPFNSEAPVSSPEYRSLILALSRAEEAIIGALSAAETADGAANRADSSAEEANSAIIGASNAADLANESARAADRAAKAADTSAVNAKQSAELAREASNRAEAAAEAARGAERLSIRAEQGATGADITVTDRDGTQTTVHIDTVTAINSWSDIRNAVRLGLGARLFPVGTELTVGDSASGNGTAWLVCAHDRHRAANRHLAHTMTLERKHPYSIQLDAPEAMYYAETGLSAGTYNFIWNYEWDTVKGGSFQFTLAKPVPAGGQLRLGTNEIHTALTDCKITAYAAVGDADFIENNVAVTEGADGINLGRIDLSSSTDKNLNCAQRILWGSNNYAQSAARQWLNSDREGEAVWTPTNIFDRRPSMLGSVKGFSRNLPSDFCEAVQTAKIPCRTNSVFETDSLDGTPFSVNQIYEVQDKFFMLSRPELYGDWDDARYKDGEQLEYYADLGEGKRIKYNENGIPQHCWLRSPNAAHAGAERYVDTSGALGGGYAYYSYGVTPACIIA